MASIGYIQPQRWSHFKYFNSYGADGAETSSVATDGGIWALKDVRVHLSVVHASVEYLVVRVSAADGSAYNVRFVSQAMSDVSDYLYIPDDAGTYGLILQSDDQLVITLSLASATNVIGININGWAVLG